MRWHQSRIGIFSTAKTYCGNLVHSSPVRSTPSNRAIPARGMATSSSAYIDADLEVAGSKSGVLSGLTFAVKDMYDVRGQKIGFGNPTWRETHAAATEHSVSVQALLDAGASLKGRTHMDELAYSLNGENMHYGTPTNPACPDRIPGGSSSGSAVATADGDVDFALGSDTGGSVRVPASYCGVLGIRPSHGRASLDGACPLAPSFDTCGWFARDPETLGKVGRVLLQGTRPTSQFKFGRLLVGEDAFSLADKETAMSLFQRVKPHKEALESAFGNMQEVSILGGAVEGISTFQDWFHTFRIVQGAEAWKALGGWISEAKPQFGPGIKERFQAASKLQPGQVEEMEGKREAIAAHMEKLLGDNSLLILPAAPGPAPRLQTPAAQLDGFRTRLISLTCIAGLAKLPQVTIPCAKVEGCPVGLGIVGPRGSDEALLEAAHLIFSMLNEAKS